MDIPEEGQVANTKAEQMKMAATEKNQENRFHEIRNHLKKNDRMMIAIEANFSQCRCAGDQQNHFIKKCFMTRGLSYVKGMLQCNYCL